MTNLGLDSIIFISYLMTRGSLLSTILGKVHKPKLLRVFQLICFINKGNYETAPPSLPPAVIDYRSLGFKLSQKKCISNEFRSYFIQSQVGTVRDWSRIRKVTGVLTQEKKVQVRRCNLIVHFGHIL